VNASTVKPCPQNHFCPKTTLTSVGAQSLVSCNTVAKGSWTRNMGATSAAQCCAYRTVSIMCMTEVYIVCHQLHYLQMGHSS
jgi:hypothetical protein